VRSIHYAIERQQIEEQLRQQALRDRLLGKTIEHIRPSIDAASILQSTVAEVRQFLKTDRVLIYRCQDWASQLDGEEQKGAIVAGDGLPLGYIENPNISAAQHLRRRGKRCRPGNLRRHRQLETAPRAIVDRPLRYPQWRQCYGDSFCPGISRHPNSRR
jgi:GAF domain-containing protein